jgi:hypothetical protein
MRFAFVPFVVLVCSSVGAATATTTDPTVEAAKIDMTRMAPQPSSVNVLNWPETQAVSGSVSVDNLPAVQTVGGTVNVGNLPLDTDGAVRVTSAPPREMVWYELLNGPIQANCGTQCSELPTIVNTTGYSRIGIQIRWNDQGGTVVASPVWRWVDDETFDPVADYRGTCSFNGSGARSVCPVAGGSLKLRVAWSTPVTPANFQSIRVYLFP